MNYPYSKLHKIALKLFSFPYKIAPQRIINCSIAQSFWKKLPWLSVLAIYGKNKKVSCRYDKLPGSPLRVMMTVLRKWKFEILLKTSGLEEQKYSITRHQVNSKYIRPKVNYKNYIKKLLAKKNAILCVAIKK